MTSPQKRQLKEQRHEIPQMTSPHEGQLREKSQGVKREHDIRFPKGEEHLHFEEDVCEDQMEATANPKHFQHLQQHLQQQQQTHEGLHATELQTERVATQPTFEKLRPTKLHVPPSQLESIEGFPFEFELGKRMVQDLGSSTEGCGDPMTDKYTKVCGGGSYKSNESR